MASLRSHPPASTRLAFALSLCALAACQHGTVTPAATSPYAAQEMREIKALSADEVQGYLSGERLGQHAVTARAQVDAVAVEVEPACISGS